MPDKLWSGRFASGPDPRFERFSASLPDDLALFPFDLTASVAHVHALARAGVLTPAEAGELERALRELLAAGAEAFPWREGDEDIHSAVERILSERLGDLGLRLHAGRSRNDQVAVDTHLYARSAALLLARRALELVAVLHGRAEEAGETVVPGMTHLQRAQPVLLAHHLLAYGWMFYRDARRFLAASESAMEFSPLGAGALAGTGFPLDPVATAAELGFQAPYPNSIDAVSDRDYLLELLFACTLTMTHLSRLAEEVVLWSSTEFARVRLSDGFSTGSSMMPQKRNPDSAELIRGKTGAVLGHLVALFTTLKALPLAYMRDLQEDKPAVYAAVRATESSLAVMAGALAEAQFLPVPLAAGDPMVATELADALVRRGLPFREAHRLVAELVRLAEARGGGLERLTEDDLRKTAPDLLTDLASLLDPQQAVHRRSAYGGTAPAAVAEQKRLLKARLAELEGALKAAEGPPSV